MINTLFNFEKTSKAIRIAECSLSVVKNTVYLNYPARVIIETVSILKQYGMSGLAGVLMRKDFVEAVETLKRIRYVCMCVCMYIIHAHTYTKFSLYFAIPTLLPSLKYFPSLPPSGLPAVWTRCFPSLFTS